MRDLGNPPSIAIVLVDVAPTLASWIGRAIDRRVWVFALVIGSPSSAPLEQGPDERAVEVARRALDAMEREWFLAEYDDIHRVRVGINLRGEALAATGLTANLVADRPNRRWRLDASGDIGPLTLIVDGQRSTLIVPELDQYAHGEPNALGLWGLFDRRLMSEIGVVRRRLNDGYAHLLYRGEEVVGGAVTHRVEDTPAPGVTATYWIDGEMYLPRRAEWTDLARGVTTIDLHYQSGRLPSRIEVHSSDPVSVHIEVSPTYDERGRVKRLHAVSRAADGGLTTLDLNLDWAPTIGADFFDHTAPADADQVPFEQLASGVALTAVAKLAPSMPFIMGAR